MPTKISTGVGDPLVSLIFITIACKITNNYFSLHLFGSFLKEYTIITSWRAPTIN